MACKPEHVVDLESGAIVTAVLHPADQGDTSTLDTTLATSSAARFPLSAFKIGIAAQAGLVGRHNLTPFLR